MGELEQQIFFLMSTGLSLNKIKEKLNLPDQMFLNTLKNLKQFHQFHDKDYYDTGEIFYNRQQKKRDHESRHHRLHMGNNKLRVLFISDLHCGNVKDNLGLLNQLYEYAITQNIHVIINTGDFIENIYHLEEKKLREKTVMGQIRRAIRLYPYAPQIINLNLYGNHDQYSLKEDGINVGEIIEQERYDLVFLGYGEAYIDVLDDYFALQHNLINKSHQRLSEDSKLVFKGHSHKTKYDVRDGEAHIYVPTLSDAYPAMTGFKCHRGFLDVEIVFDLEGKMDRVYIQNFIIEKKPSLASEFVLSLKKK